MPRNNLNNIKQTCPAITKLKQQERKLSNKLNQ